MYVGIVAMTGLLGTLVAVFGPENLRPVSLLGLVELSPTPLGLALYGMVTVGVVLGVLLAAVAVVSDRLETERVS